MATSHSPRARSHRRRVRVLGIEVALLGTLAAGPHLLGQTASMQAPTGRTSGPVAISASGSGHLAVLQADGALFDFDVTTGLAKVLYRVPGRYQVIETAAGRLGTEPIVGVVIYQREASSFQSYVLQIVSDREPVWCWLPPEGLYVGLAIEETGRVAYVGNSSSNEVYELPLGKQASPRYLMRVSGATRLGVFAYDRASQTIVAVDVDQRQLYRLDVRTKASERIARVAEAGDLRAIAWAAAARRVFLADSERQTVWAIDLASPNTPARRFVTDPAFREPAGLALLDGSLWVADEGAGMLFEVALKTGQVVRKMAWPPRPAG